MGEAGGGGGGGGGVCVGGGVTGGVGAGRCRGSGDRAALLASSVEPGACKVRGWCAGVLGESPRWMCRTLPALWFTRLLRPANVIVQYWAGGG